MHQGFWGGALLGPDLGGETSEGGSLGGVCCLFSFLSPFHGSTVLKCLKQTELIGLKGGIYDHLVKDQGSWLPLPPSLPYPRHPRLFFFF